MYKLNLQTDTFNKSTQFEYEQIIDFAERTSIASFFKNFYPMKRMAKKWNILNQSPKNRGIYTISLDELYQLQNQLKEKNYKLMVMKIEMFVLVMEAMIYDLVDKQQKIENYVKELIFDKTEIQITSDFEHKVVAFETAYRAYLCTNKYAKIGNVCIDDFKNFLNEFRIKIDRNEFFRFLFLADCKRISNLSKI